MRCGMRTRRWKARGCTISSRAPSLVPVRYLALYLSRRRRTRRTAYIGARVSSQARARRHSFPHLGKFVQGFGEVQLRLCAQPNACCLYARLCIVHLWPHGTGLTPLHADCCASAVRPHAHAFLCTQQDVVRSPWCSVSACKLCSPSWRVTQSWYFSLPAELHRKAHRRAVCQRCRQETVAAGWAMCSHAGKWRSCGVCTAGRCKRAARAVSMRRPRDGSHLVLIPLARPCLGSSDTGREPYVLCQCLVVPRVPGLVTRERQEGEASLGC